MTIFFDLPDDGYSPIFNEESIDIKIAMVLSKKFSQSLSEISIERREKIPHAISCIYNKDTCFYINSNIDIKKEEEILSPPESAENTNWRRTEQRLIYLVVQLFYSLVAGRLPKTKIAFLPSKILCNLSESNMVLLKEFFTYGLEKDLQERYQNILQLQESMDIILKRLALQNTKRLQVPITSRKTKSIYTCELKLYNFISNSIDCVDLCGPAQVNIGRKLNTGNKKLKVKMEWGVVYEGFDAILQMQVYDIIIPQDNCISRHHAEIILDKNPLNCSIKDLGSTHGTMVFTDATCTSADGILVGSNNSIRFITPSNQHLQVGNTRISVSIKDYSDYESYEN